MIHLESHRKLFLKLQRFGILPPDREVWKRPKAHGAREKNEWFFSVGRAPRAVRR
jgi:hypothetical protein